MKRWFKYIKPYLPYFILGPVCMLVEVAGEAVMPRLLGIIINNANDGTLTTGGSIGIMILMIVIAIIMMAGGVGGAYFASKASVNFAADLRADIYGKIQNFSFENIDKFSTGSLVTRLTNDVTQIQNLINMMMRMALRAPGMMIASLIMAILLKPKLSVVFAVSIPLMLVAVGFIIKTGFPRFTKVQTKLDKLNSTVQENVTNVRVVKSFVREDYETEKFRAANKDLKNTGISASKVMIFMQPVMTLIMNITVVAVVLIGSRLILNMEMTPGDLSSFIMYVTQILMSLVMVTFMFTFSSRALASSRRIREVLDEPINLTDDDAADKERKVERGDIEFKNVSFRYYKNSEDKVLDDISLTIPGGSTVGIIGSTGCGKSTLISMIPRLYDCDEGGSIAENLRWGDEEADDETVKRMAKYAQADKFVSSFKDGYDTMLVQGGTNVSGGQKQRLCIARALLKQPKILILDDSTSAVDTATEAMIRRAFKEELQGSTKIIIAQRISSVMESDMIIVMNDGKITGIGTHDELLSNNVEYREIYESQTGGKN